MRMRMSKRIYLGNVLLRSSLMKTWLPFWTALISVLCPVSCLLQFFFFFTEQQKKRQETVKNSRWTTYIQRCTVNFDLLGKCYMIRRKLRGIITSAGDVMIPLSLPWSVCATTSSTIYCIYIVSYHLTTCPEGIYLHVDLPWVFSQFGQWYMSISGASSSSTPTQLKWNNKSC